MAMQDDIMALLSQVSAGGDRATARQDRGIELYENIGSLIGDSPNYRKALRELTGLGSREDMTLEEEMRNDAGLSDRVASIIEKYMADAATIGEVPADMIVDDTGAAEQPIPTPEEFMGMAAQERSVPDDMIVDDTRAAEAMMEADREAAIRAQDEGLAGLLAGQEAPEAGLLVGTPPTPIQTGGDYGEFAGTPGTSIAPARVSDGRIPLKERLFAGQEAAGGPMSAGEQLMFAASSFIPVAMLPAAAAKVGIGAAQVARFLRAGKKGEQALREVIKKREYARDAQGRFVSPNQGVPNPTPGARMTERATPGKGPGLNMEEAARRTMESFGRTGGAAGGGSVGNIRDGIMRNYAMMADGKSVSRHLGIKPEKGEPQVLPKYQMYFPTSPEEISDIRDRLDEDKSYGRQIRKYLNPYYLSDVLSKMGKDD